MRGFLISEQSEILHMRREAEALAKGLGFSPEDCGRLAIIATELATNLLKHAGHGEILLGLSENTSVPCVELIALDQGPGMVDVDACLVDGYSTAGSQGTGLGAAKRQATSFDIYSGLNLGAAVHVRVCPSKTKFKPRELISLGRALARPAGGGLLWRRLRGKKRNGWVFGDGRGRARPWRFCCASKRRGHPHIRKVQHSGPGRPSRRPSLGIARDARRRNLGGEDRAIERNSLRFRASATWPAP